MRAIRFHEYGTPDVLRYEDAPDPAAYDGAALVRVSAVSVNPIDLKTRSGATKGRIAIVLPYILGVDLAGTVIATGAGVQALRQSDPVMGLQRRLTQSCASLRPRALL